MDKTLLIKKTIVLSYKTHARLGTYAKLKGETYEEIITRLMNDYDINKIKKERLKNGKI